MRNSPPPKLLRLLLLGLIAALLAACTAESQAGVATLDGGDTKAGDAGEETDSGDAEEQLVKWADCMRENGIDIPDASVDGDGNMRITRRVERPADAGERPQGGIVRLDEDFGKAQEECGEPPRVAGSGPSEKEIEELQENALKLAQCMRENGVADFPDPDFSDFGPGSGPQRASRAGGPFGGIDMDDPKVQAAFEKCQEANPDAPIAVRIRPGGQAD